MKTVTLNKMIDKLGLKNLVPEVETDGIEINSAEINRPALQLAGYFEHFACERVQIIGYVEYAYMKQMSEERRMGVETYLYDFTGDIYGRDIRVELLAFRRQEMKFDSVEKLKAQMLQDIAAGRNYPG